MKGPVCVIVWSHCNFWSIRHVSHVVEWKWGNTRKQNFISDHRPTPPLLSVSCRRTSEALLGHMAPGCRAGGSCLWSSVFCRRVGGVYSYLTGLRSARDDAGGLPALPLPGVRIWRQQVFLWGEPRGHPCFYATHVVFKELGLVVKIRKSLGNGVANSIKWMNLA